MAGLRKHRVPPLAVLVEQLAQIARLMALRACAQSRPEGVAASPSRERDSAHGLSGHLASAAGWEGRNSGSNGGWRTLPLNESIGNAR